MSPRALVAVIGAGPAGLMATEVLATAGVAVTVYERMPSPARKLLMAGRGGLNLTHSEPLAKFLERYGASRPSVEAAVRALPPEALVAWAHSLGQDTFTGSSGRVFPTAMKASPLLRAWLTRLASLGVVMKTNHRWTGWDNNGALRFVAPAGHPATTHAAATLLALGGASWPRLGSDAQWVEILRARGVSVNALTASNCGVRIPWSQRFLDKAEGAPLKRIALTLGQQTQRGEAVITSTGLEGGAVYALGAALRQALPVSDAPGPTTTALWLDLRPDDTTADVAQRLAVGRAKQSLSNHLRKRLNLPPAAIAIINEVSAGRPPTEAMQLASLIKAVPLPVSALAGLERAISSAGGIAAEALTPDFMLRDAPGVFAAGEMLDWDAPTGGYLLQASFATGAAAAHGILAHLATQQRQPAAL